MASKSKTSPSAHFLKVMMSLYFVNKVEPWSGTAESESLPPMEALVLGMMCLEGKYNSRSLSLRLRLSRTFDCRECDVMAEAGILQLVQRGYLKPASKKAALALENRDDRVWGLGNVPFVVTAKGAKRIGFLVANTTGENVKDVIVRLQAESKEKAKAWTPE